MDPAQILLFIVIIILMILLIVLGIQVYFVLKDIRKTLAKANRVLDNTGDITEAVAGPVTGLSTAIMGVKTGSSLMGLFNRFSGSANKEEKHHHGK
jgi:hypothetical protein